jgi:hypothetical protein
MLYSSNATGRIIRFFGVVFIDSSLFPNRNLKRNARLEYAWLTGKRTVLWMKR